MHSTDPHSAVHMLTADARTLLQSRRDQGLYRRAAAPQEGIWLSFASNDYFALSHDRRVCKAALRATESFGVGSGGSRLLRARHLLHTDIEALLERHLPAGWRSVYVNSGTAANSVFFDVLKALSPGAELFVDHLAHSSLLAAAKQSGLRLRHFPHGDWSGLASRLQRSDARTKVIVTEALHSMEGDFLDFEALSQVCQQTPGCAVYLDEAHSAGLMGLTGACFRPQTWALLQNHLVGTMLGCGKALGASGGILLLPEALAQMCYQQGRQLIYTTDAPPATYAAVLTSLEIVEKEGDTLRAQLRDSLIKLVDCLSHEAAQHDLPLSLVQSDARGPIQRGRLRKEALSRPSFQVIIHSEPSHSAAILSEACSGMRSPIVTIDHPDVAALRKLGDGLQARGIAIPLIRPPTVPRGRERLRLSIGLGPERGAPNQLGTDDWHARFSKILVATMRDLS